MIKDMGRAIARIIIKLFCKLDKDLLLSYPADSRLKMKITISLSTITKM
jgi:hypothetical protein